MKTSPALRLPLLGLAVLVLILGPGCARAPERLPTGPPGPSPVGPDSFVVAFESTQGRFVVSVHRDWAPLAADRVYDLVRRKVYDDIRVFRVVSGYVAQFGLTGDSAVNRAWAARGLPDEPVLQPNTRGRVAFARGGPQTRSMQIFIDLGNNSPRLDTLTASGVVGYPPFGEVVEGMDLVDRFYAEYGNAPSRQQDSIRALGNAWLDRVYPKLDRIRTARVTREWR
jgi:cyclophilin family peptidyl-prolyl cis-trans isomerase